MDAERHGVDERGEAASWISQPVTRRVVIGTGLAYTGSVIWSGSGAFAATPNPLRRLANLRRSLGRAPIDSPLKRRLVSIVASAENNLKRGRRTQTRAQLQQLNRVLTANGGRHGLSAKEARGFVAEARKIVAAIPPTLAPPSDPPKVSGGPQGPQTQTGPQQTNVGDAPQSQTTPSQGPQAPNQAGPQGPQSPVPQPPSTGPQGPQSPVLQPPSTGPQGPQSPVLQPPSTGPQSPPPIGPQSPITGPQSPRPTTGPQGPQGPQAPRRVGVASRW